MKTLARSNETEALKTLMEERPEIFFWAMTAAFGWFFATPVTARADRQVGYIEEFPKARFISTLKLLWSVVEKGADCKALQRINQTHASAGISTQDFADEFRMIIAVFVCEGIRFSSSYSSSKVSAEEQAIWFNFWTKDVANAMDITGLPSSIKALTRWLTEFKNAQILTGGNEDTHALGAILFGLLQDKDILQSPHLHVPEWVRQDGQLAPAILAAMDDKVLGALGAPIMPTSQVVEVERGMRSRSSALEIETV
ncbi:hypothetical protein [Moritella sp.]|uniref:hypothetical protein n=1 Tax=Moritella sp. TaxID=78556 RepID=UPI001DB05228|nr:hypothetical protein [Moritella sp.]MCJ8350084.1 hypothetical protein [Moritella sp.]NQZ39623.1 hypothetical protein [Moritella sp.]